MSKQLISAVLALAIVLIPAFGVSEQQSCAYAKRLEIASARQEMVYFNTNTHKYHSQDCVWAQRCTRNCILITRAEAIQRGGIPCKVCGGG